MLGLQPTLPSISSDCFFRIDFSDFEQFDKAGVNVSNPSDLIKFFVSLELVSSGYLNYIM